MDGRRAEEEIPFEDTAASSGLRPRTSRRPSSLTNASDVETIESRSGQIRRMFERCWKPNRWVPAMKEEEHPSEELLSEEQQCEAYRSAVATASSVAGPSGTHSRPDPKTAVSGESHRHFGDTGDAVPIRETLCDWTWTARASLWRIPSSVMPRALVS